MRFKALVIITVLASLAGCVAPMEQEQPLASVAAELTLEECADQRDACFSNNPFFGLFTCPLQYNQCVVTADDGLPAQVEAAISDARDCAAEARSCRAAAESPVDLLLCTEDAAVCVAAIVDAQIPTVVSGTLECVDGALSCINSAESVGDLAGCAETLEECALDQVVEVLPPEVGEVVQEVGECQLQLTTCTLEARTPSALAQCAEDNVACVAGSLDVQLPTPPIADALQCAENAAVCTLEARSLSELGMCGDGLIACTGALIEQELTCAQQWTACLNANPFNFFGCAAELAVCQD